MELFVFLDLDDTLFQTQRKCVPKTKITPAAFLKDGSPISFFTEKQHYLFNLLKSNTHLVPTTARNKESFSRVCIKNFDYAILNHGGIILNAEGHINTNWFEFIAPKINPLLSVFQALETHVQHFAQTQNIPLKIRLTDDFGLIFNLLIKHQFRDNKALTHLTEFLLKPYLKTWQLDFYCHLNDNNLMVLPKFLNKASAVKFLQQQLNTDYPDYLSFGIGDSLTDMPYMQLCDYFITPTNSQIMQEFFLDKSNLS